MPDTIARIREAMRDIAESYEPSPELADRIERSAGTVDVNPGPAVTPRPGPVRRGVGRRTPAIAWALSLLILVAAIVFFTVRTGSPSHARGTAMTARSHANSKKPRPPETATRSEVPKACRAKPVLAPQAATPSSWPTNFQILNVMPGVLASQYPTVYDSSGLQGPGNSQYVVFETVHDPALETEVREAASGTQPPMPTSFVIVPHTLACLSDIQSEVSSSMKTASRAGIVIYGFGLQTNDVEVQISNCGVSGARAVSWFEARWGTLVRVLTCTSMPTTDPLIIKKK